MRRPGLRNAGSLSVWTVDSGQSSHRLKVSSALPVSASLSDPVKVTDVVFLS